MSFLDNLISSLGLNRTEESPVDRGKRRLYESLPSQDPATSIPNYLDAKSSAYQDMAPIDVANMRPADPNRVDIEGPGMDFLSGILSRSRAVEPDMLSPGMEPPFRTEDTTLNAMQQVPQNMQTDISQIDPSKMDIREKLEKLNALRTRGVSQPEAEAIKEQVEKPQETPQKESDLEAAQKRRDEMQQALLMLQGLGQIGTALGSGGTQKFDPSVVQGAMKMAERPVSNIQERQAQRMSDMRERMTKIAMGDTEAMRDPNSTVSKTYRQQIQSLAKMADLDLGDLVSNDKTAFELKEVAGYVNNMLNAQIAQAGRIEQAKVRGEAKEAQRLEKQSREKDQLQNQIIKQISKPIEGFGKDQETAARAQSVISQDGSITGAEDIALLYDFIKGVDPGSVVREGEIALTQGAESLWNNIRTKMTRLTTNAVNSRETRLQLAEIINSIVETRDKVRVKQLMPQYIRAQRNEIPLEEIFPMELATKIDKYASDYVDEDLKIKPKQETQTSEAPYGDEVERNGKRYKWNPAVGKYQLLGN